MPQLRYAQTRYLSVLLLSWLIVFLLTRTVLLFFHLADADVGLFDVLRLYGIGLVYDLSFLLYAALPPALYLLLCPARLWRSKGHAIFLHALMGVALFAMLFVAVIGKPFLIKLFHSDRWFKVVRVLIVLDKSSVGIVVCRKV